MLSRRNDQTARAENIHELKGIVLFRRQHRNAAEQLRDPLARTRVQPFHSD